MESPELQGASQIIGGHIRGRAHGNVYNVGDGYESTPNIVKKSGKVHIFTDIDAQSREDKPRM